MLFPMHIATRGRLDGEYGIATRGLIICPDIVPRFPSAAETVEEGWFAVVNEADLTALLRDWPKLTFEATALEGGLLLCTVDGERHELQAAVEALDLRATVRELEATIGDAQEPGLQGTVTSDRDIGDVTEEDERATVAEADVLVGDAEDEPPHC